MLSLQNEGKVKIPFRSKVMPFLIIAYRFCSHGKGDFRLAAVVLGQWGAINATSRADYRW